ncbi:unnamed protein product [Miscanthus lutarioriparius]|uniref:DUF4283 domain-containing protein n=1 Tax=Miscanthus lutarioriparius TaxID=422564 RepID=A0A811R8Z4_9POAL|nr:unnamed protein product [Miscanthus lutarioriparius]
MVAVRELWLLVKIDCNKEPICYKCKEKGHMTIDYKSSDTKKINTFGFGIPGQGFYALIFPEAKIKTHQSTGLLTVLEGEACEEKVDKELKNLVRDKWDFKVKQIHHQEFLVVFLDKGSLDTFTKLVEFQMSLYRLKGRLERTVRDSKTSSLLLTVWIKVHGVPDFAREVEAMKEIVGLVAEPLVVDELSLIRNEPVRVQGRCRNPGAIRGSIEIFFNGIGKLIRFEVEGVS